MLIDETSVYVAGTEDDMGMTNRLKSVKLDSVKSAKSEQAQFSPNPYEFIE